MCQSATTSRATGGCENAPAGSKRQLRVARRQKSAAHLQDRGLADHMALLALGRRREGGKVVIKTTPASGATENTSRYEVKVNNQKGIA